MGRIFEEANDAIIVLDVFGDRILRANRRACDLTGYGRDDLLARPLSAICPDDVDKLRHYVQSVARRDLGWTDELTCRTRGGRRIPAELSASLINVDGAVHVLAVVRDVSMRKSTEARFRDSYERMRVDMETATRMQKSLLPRVSPVFPGVRFAWEIFATGELAGDTLNVFRLDPERVGFFLLDVSGHGAAAAMMSMAIHRLLTPNPGPPSVLFRSDPGGAVTGVADPADVCRDLNTHFQMDASLPQYFTLLYGFLEAATGELRCASAGHCPPVYVPPHGALREVRGAGPPIGFFRDADYRAQRLVLEPGSRLYLYSDGMTDAFNKAGETFGRERLLPAIDSCRDEPLAGSLTSLLGEMRNWSHDTRLEDDVSLLAIERAGSSSEA